MNKKVPSNVLRRVFVMLIAVTLLFCAIAAPQAEAVDFKASYIKENNDLQFDLEDYIDGDVMFKLPAGVSDDEEISVIITVDVINLMDAYDESDKTMSFAEFALNSEKAAQIKEQINSEKAAILEQLDQKAISYKVGDTYDTLLSGFELLIKAGDFKATCKSLDEDTGVILSEVYKAADTQLVENNVNVYETGIFKSEGSGYDGTGMVVAVLDTGLDYAHSAFSTANFTSTKWGLDYKTVASLLSQTTAYKQVEGLTADDVYISNKVPFGFDYADSDSDVYSVHNNHGTHVSGVICGKDDTITGVAPNAQLVSMKVFSSVMDTARSTWILSALEDCVVLGVDVINMSLGQSAGFTRQSDEEVISGVYTKIREHGISLIVAASNSYASSYGSESNGNLGLTSNPDSATVGSPGTYLGAMSVASISGVETPYIMYNGKIIYFSETTNGASEPNDFFETLLGDKDSVDMEFVLIHGVGRSADYEGVDVAGKIALVRRGSNTFEEKAMIAQSKGAAGIIIYNNVSGDIKMNVGDATLAACSISQDMGEMLAEAGSGTLKISKSQTSGPFMSDFSSWGPTPSLGIKPEITAHGGNILSSINGGGYDRLSGTSMACPNIAGVAVLLRQFVVEKFPEIKDDDLAVNIMINRLMMSTADIVINKNGLPYAVRKQGAGLANLTNCINTPAILLTYDEDGKAMDKTKLELGHDPEMTGVYEMTFGVKNLSGGALSYDIGAYVMTEGVSDTLTSHGETTVTEEAYLLAGAKLEVVKVENGSVNGMNLTVSGNQEAKVTVKITLSDADKKYLTDSFENGMFVEGFITLKATSGTEINLNVPYLAFFGDWTKAPMFDLDYFQTDADERDDSIPVEDKVMPDGYATRPIGGVQSDYVSYLGSYYFVQDPNDMVISANKEYIALSNQEGTIHSLSFLWIGTLRNAERIVITIVDDATGEVVYETVDDLVRKSYGDGGPIRPQNVDIKFDTKDYNLSNNSKFTVKVQGYLDYEDGGLETNLHNYYEFPLTIDYQAPTVEDVEFYYEYDKTLKKNRLYAKIGIYDNHFTMCMQMGYVKNSAEGIALEALEQYMTPVYSKENSTTYVTYELTDYIHEIKANAYNKNTFVVSVYDYCLNYATFEIGLPDDYTDFYFEGLGETLTMSPNEIFSLAPSVYPNTEWAELLDFSTSNNRVVRVVNDKLVAVGSGKATVRVRDPLTNKSTTFQVEVLKEGDEGFKRYDKPVADTFKLLGYDTIRAYFQLDSEQYTVGREGDTRYFELGYSMEMYPSESVLLNYKLDAYFPNDTKVVFSSSNENIVKVDANGLVTGVAEGFASVTVKVTMDGKNTFYSQTITIEIRDPFLTTGPSLTHYFGLGGVVNVPAKLHLTNIGSFAFSNYDYVDKTPEEIAFDDAATTKQWPIGDNTITKVVIPEGVKRIDSYAFAYLTALEEIVFPSTLEDIAYGAFMGCTSLKKITFSGENNLKIINKDAFLECDLNTFEQNGTTSKVLDLPKAYIIADYAFAGNVNMEGIKLPKTLQSIGSYAFAGCKKLSDVTVTADRVKYGSYAFNGCESLKSFTVNASIIPTGMFYQCTNLESVTIGANVNAINEYAFRETKVGAITIADGSTAFQVGTAQYVLSADGKTLITVSPLFQGSLSAADLGGADITTVGRGAFSNTTKLTSVSLPNVTVVADFGFASATRLEKVELGTLTSIGAYAFSETRLAQMPSFTAATTIGRYAFMDTKLTEVVLPDGMVIGEGAFSDTYELKTVTIGNNVTLGDFAFYLDENNLFTIKSEQVDDQKFFYYEFASNLKNLTIGNDVVIGNNAFDNAFSLETVTLGENAVIGNMAFYNNQSLKNIDLSKAASIGEYAFSGDQFSKFFDQDCTVPAWNKQGMYEYTFHATSLESVDLSSATKLGAYAFALCEDLADVKLGDGITEIGDFAFARTLSLKNINLEKVQVIGEQVFTESAIPAANMLSANSIGKYAFIRCENLTEVTLNPAGTELKEGAFAYASNLETVHNMNAVQFMDKYAFAYTALKEADLSGAVSIGDQAFLKEDHAYNLFTVKLGDALVSLGDNPFAGSKLESFYKVEEIEFNGTKYETKSYTYDIGDKIKVINGSLYAVVENGLELIAYAGQDPADAQVAEDTVRITAFAFAGSDVQMVTLPHTVASVGHKAFYECKDLKIVVFNSYEAPILEEEFDAAYYESMEHIPGSGNYGDYENFDGTNVSINGLGIIPYFMWNVTGDMYSNVFYGANFIDYVGYVNNKLLMVRPSNGQSYDTYMLGHYFDLTVDGAAAKDAASLAFMKAVSKLPERVNLEHESLVVAARAAYNKIGSTEQKALVESGYTKLVSAEQTIQKIKDSQVAPPPPPGGGDEKPSAFDISAVIIVAVAVILAGLQVFVCIPKKAKTEKKLSKEEPKDNTTTE